MELRLPIGKFALFDSFAHFGHDDLVEMQVVDGVELCAQDFADSVQVVQVGAAEVLACVAGAAFINRTLVEFVFGVFDLQIAKTGKQPAVTCIAGSITQSNISTPCATPYTKSSGVPTPIK